MYNRTLWKLGLTVLGLLLAAGIFVPMPARADNLSLSLLLPTSVSAGGTGAFDVVLSDAAGGTGVTVGGFDFDVEVAATSGVTLTGADTSVPSVPGYIFSGNSLFGPVLTDSGSTPTDLTASDIAAIFGTGYTLAGGGSIDLGEVLFDVSPTAPTEMANVQFVSGIFNTDLSDPNGVNIPINNETGGAIDIIGTAVPEPSTLIMLLGAIPFALLIGLRTQRRFEG
jgi:hypothetical protein